MGAGVVLLLMMPMAVSFVIPYNAQICSSSFRAGLCICPVHRRVALPPRPTRHGVAAAVPRCSSSSAGGIQWIDADMDPEFGDDLNRSCSLTFHVPHAAYNFGCLRQVHQTGSPYLRASRVASRQLVSIVSPRSRQKRTHRSSRGRT